MKKSDPEREAVLGLINWIDKLIWRNVQDNLHERTVKDIKDIIDYVREDYGSPRLPRDIDVYA